MYSRWKTHKWRKCQLVPWFLRQNSAGAQETCGPGLQTRGIETNLFISASSLHLHWTIPNHRKLNLCSLHCIWSPAMRQQMDVPRFREKANLLRAHIKSSHLQDSTHLEADAPKNICKRLFSDLFLFFCFSPELGEDVCSQLVICLLRRVWQFSLFHCWLFFRFRLLSCNFNQVSFVEI